MSSSGKTHRAAALLQRRRRCRRPGPPPHGVPLQRQHRGHLHGRRDLRPDDHPQGCPRRCPALPPRERPGHRPVLRGRPVTLELPPRPSSSRQRLPPGNQGRHRDQPTKEASSRPASRPASPRSSPPARPSRSPPPTGPTSPGPRRAEPGSQSESQGAPGPAAGVFFGYAMAMLRTLVLMGRRGSGKSTVGRHIAERSGRPFIDLDIQTARTLGTQASAKPGTVTVRQRSGLRKSQALAAALQQPGAVVALGGGTPTAPARARSAAPRTRCGPLRSDLPVRICRDAARAAAAHRQLRQAKPHRGRPAR